VVFATNLAPKDLVDEAFLRRIRHKIEVDDPDWGNYREIFKRVCRSKEIPWDERALAYLIQEHYIKAKRSPRGCHPRDLLDQIVDIAEYMNVSPGLSKELIDRAANGYFVDLEA
jgi:SpoVK/Ycf46/Vps4 family AAA+-type ATPase